MKAMHPSLQTIPRILIVDDEAPMRHFLRVSLGALDFMVIEAGTADEAITRMHESAPDLLLLDLGLPDLDGRQVIADIRKISALPIVVLSGRTEDSEKIAALEQGADDYITKPFAMPDLVRRIRAALLQHDRFAEASATIRTGGLSIDMQKDAVTNDRHAVTLNTSEYALLRLLALHGGRVVTAGRIGQMLWQDKSHADRGAEVRQHIKSLRSKLEAEPAFPSYIVTEPAVGYRLVMLPTEQ